MVSNLIDQQVKKVDSKFAVNFKCILVVKINSKILQITS